MQPDLDSHIDYHAYFSKHVARAKTSGDQMTGLCPFHEDRNASFGVNLKTGQWRCYAGTGCGHGNVVDFHARMTQTDTKSAYKELCRIHDIPMNGNGGAPDRSRRPAKAEVKTTIPPETIEPFLQIPPKLKNYLLEKRGWSESVIQEYKIGYNPKGRRPAYTIPVYDEHGDLVNIRTYAPGTANKIMSWGKGFGTSRIYPLGVLDRARAEGKPVYLCEGEPDALCGLSQGLLCVTQTAGADTWKTWFNALFKGLDIIIAYDNDEAGRTGAQKVTRHLPHFARSVSVLQWPEWMEEKEDLTDWFVKYGKSVEELQALERLRPPSAANGDPGGGGGGDDTSAAFEEINKHHAVIMVGGRTVVMNEVIDPVFERPDVTFSPISDFKAFYANQRVMMPNGNGMKAVSLGKAWLESPARRQYKGIVFAPGKEVPDHYNLYRGLALEPKPGKWDRYQDHLFEVIAGGSREVFNYIVAWMAHLVQSPGGELPGTSIVLRGKQGTGKGCFVSHLGALLGSHFIHITNSNQITGRFNQHLKDALLVFIDEGFWAGDRQAEGILKGMVTEKHIAIEPKGKDAFMVENHMRLIVASNNDWVIPAGLDERRFFVIDVSDKKMQDREYFKGIHEEMKNGGREAMLHDLLGLNIEDFDFGKFPRTNALLDQIINTMHITHKFWFEVLRRGELLKSGSTSWDLDGLVQTSSLYDEYLEFARNLGCKRPDIDNNFTRRIREVCKPVFRERLTGIAGVRSWHLRFPSLNECRKCFEKAIRMEVNWDE